MFKWQKYKVLFTAAILIMTALTALIFTGCGGWVARVNGKTIDEDAFNRRFAEIKAIYGDQVPSEDNPEGFAYFRGTVAEDLATRELLHNQADGMGLTFTEEEADQGVAELKKSKFQGDEAKYLAELDKEQISPDRAREELAEGMLFIRLKNRITAEVPEPTADDVKVAYEKNPGKYRLAPAVKLRSITLGGEEEAKKVIERLDNGEDMAVIAGEVSLDESTKGKGGEQGWVFKGSLEPEAEQAIFNLQTGSHSAPFKSASGWIVARVEDTRAPYQRSLEESKETIKKELWEQARDNQWEAWIERIKREASVEYRDGYKPPRK